MKLFTFVQILRVVAALSVYLNPVVAIFLSLILDSFDGFVASRNILPKQIYQRLDKLQDYFWYTNALIYSLYALPSYFFALLTLYVWRGAGMLLFLKTRNRKFFVVFANFFENIFIFAVVYETYFTNMISVNMISSIIAFLFITKVIQEIWIHYTEKSFLETFFKVKEHWRGE